MSEAERLQKWLDQANKELADTERERDTLRETADRYSKALNEALKDGDEAWELARKLWEGEINPNNQMVGPEIDELLIRYPRLRG